MLTAKILSVTGFEPAIHGMRNPMNSWDKSDSDFCSAMNCEECPLSECTEYGEFIVGKNDMDLMMRLCKAGTEHRKYLRMINAYLDIKASHVFWQEFDTYKIGTVRNSCSKMHKIHVKGFVKSDFSTKGIDECGLQEYFEKHLEKLEYLRVKFNETQEKRYWEALLELLPMGYEIMATVMLNYETVLNIIRQRHNHKWYDWKSLIDVFMTLPLMDKLSEAARC